MKSAAVDKWGILSGYQNGQGKWIQSPARNRAAIFKAMAIDPGEATKPSPLQFLRQGQSLLLPEPAELILEDGSTCQTGRLLPKDVPVGYHGLHFRHHTTRLIVSPPACFLPDLRRRRGWALQLYSLRSQKSWGMGDFSDLREFARWSRERLAMDFILLNPLGAPNPVLPQQPSPYYPSSRLYRNPLYLDLESIKTDAPLQSLAKASVAGRALNDLRLIDRDQVFQLKMPVLATIWKKFKGDAKFDHYCREEGESLNRFALFCVLTEKFGSNHSSWPQNIRTPQSSGITRFAAEYANRIKFHQWLQWLLDVQFAKASAELPLIQDLPVGFDPAGADAWAWQDILARDVSIGAPPDEFNTQGQNWGLPPFVPHKFRAAGYEPFRQTIRASLKHSRGLRIDHVMGLFRLFWIPKDASARDGAYVRYPADELLAILAIESQRAGAFIIGEDLGTVEKGVRSKLRRHNVLSYRVLWFERGSMTKTPRQSLAAVTTHDLPTIAGLWRGSDLAAQEKLGLNPNAASTRNLVRRLRRLLKLSAAAKLQDVILAVHRELARSNSMLLTATLDDALAVEERPNLPGTIKQWPNWSIALPKSLESIKQDPFLRGLAKILATGGRNKSNTK